VINNIDIGSYGENIALKYLLDKGYILLRKNYRTKCSEIDIILKKKDVLHFVEVKTRYNKNFGIPCQSINYKKKNSIIKASLIYIISERLITYNVSYDVIEVVLNYTNDSFSLNHIEGAFSQ
jgi:putative endonuclease